MLTEDPSRTLIYGFFIVWTDYQSVRARMGSRPTYTTTKGF